MKRPLSIYVHVPFCRSKCLYCDFASWPNRLELRDAYLNALIEELEGWREQLAERRIVTVFFGGGTPTLMPEGWIPAVLEAVARLGQVDADAEITMEGNPGTLDPAALRACRAAGVNRLSLGVQAMDDRLLRSLGRIHTVADAERAVETARAAGFDNLNLDLMYALPGQSERDWDDTLRRATRLSPEHISAYSLIVEEGTPLEAMVARGEAVPADEDTAVRMQRAATRALAQAGFERYEISNYAKPGRACRHNLVYWRRGDYLGIGCAAHSLLNGERFENARDPEAYMAGGQRLNRAALDTEAAMEETLMLSTRLCEGLNLDAWRAAFNEDFEQAHAAQLRTLTRGGFVSARDGRLRLTERGMEVQDAVVLTLMRA